MPRPANPEIRERLLSKGGRVIHELGFNASGVQDIVAAAAVPKGSFYSYFDSKEAFAAEVLCAYWASIERRHGVVMYDARIKPLERIEKLFELLGEEEAAAAEAKKYSDEEYKYVLIHSGNSAKSSSGCVIIGDTQTNNKIKEFGWVGASRNNYLRVYPIIVLHSTQN